MGARLSRARQLAFRDLKLKSRMSPIQEKRQAAPPFSEPESGAAGGEDWNDLLNKIGGSYTSKAWDGTVGVRAASAVARDPSAHVAQRSRQTLDKLPKRQVPIEGEGIEAGEARKHGDSLAALTRNDATENEVEPVHGSLTQNQVLEVYRLQKRDAAKWDPAAVAELFALSEEDARNLLQYNRTFVAQDQHGISRGHYKPEAGIERFEDMSAGISTGGNDVSSPSK
jgi:hypothetical protein